MSVSDVEIHNTRNKADDEGKYDGWGVRHVQVACICACSVTLFVARACMAVAVLAMTDNRKQQATTFEWDKRSQGMVLSSFFWGDLAMQVPSGLLARRWGGKPVITAALTFNGIISFALPTLAKLGGWWMVCVCRACMGLAQAGLFPSTHTLLARWLPPRERTTYAGLIHGGCLIGTMLSMLLTGILAESSLGWELIFFSIGSLQFVTLLLWQLLSANSPADHPFISSEERNYVEESLHKNSKKISHNQSVPWALMLRSRPVWAIASAHVGTAVRFVLLFADMPTYLEKGLKIPFKSSASLASLPYLGMWAGIVASSAACEAIYNRGLLSVGTCRKIFTSIGLLGSATGFICLSLVTPAHSGLAVILLIVTLTISGGTSAGCLVNHLDLSPQYAGLLQALTNSVAGVGSVLTPLLTSVILKNDPTDIGGWRSVFLSAAAFCFATNLLYLIYGTSQRQPWDSPEFQDEISSYPDEIVPALDVKQLNQERTKQ